MFNICITKNHNFTIWDWMRSTSDVITAPCHQSLEAAQYSPHGNESYSSNKHHRPSEEEEIGPAFIAGALDSKINNILETTSAVERQSVVAFSRRASN